MKALEAQLASDPFRAYAYGYPHKTAYRAFEPPLTLKDIWAEPAKEIPAFLYVHIPFCEMRCGFCNLFTSANPEAGVADRYLDALERQALAVRESVGECRFERFALGGGTPTLLEPVRLRRLFDMLASVWGLSFPAIPSSVETSPQTSDSDRLRVLSDFGVERVSIGVQSFFENETGAIGRPQTAAEARAALERIRLHGFPVLNVDLMYGLPGQTLETWRETLRAALAFEPEEIFLYPLYVRPLTGLGRKEASPRIDARLALYRAGRDMLLEAGYAQFSMRKFHRPRSTARAAAAYCCQTDRMLGLGCGARSYTDTIHFSHEYAVDSRRVRSIIDGYIGMTFDEFRNVRHGFRLDEEERRRRFLVLSLLNTDGLSLSGYAERYGGPATGHFPELSDLLRNELVERAGDRLVPTARGLELSDAIGNWLYSTNVRNLMAAYQSV